MHRTLASLIIGIVAALFFLPFLGQTHLFDWDENNFAECAREMIVTGDYLQPQIDFVPFWEKPPLFIWMQVIGMKIFGVGEYAARFPNAVCGILTLILLFNIGSRLFDRTMGWLWSGCYLGSILPHLYFKSGIIDPSFNLFILLGLYFLILHSWQHRQIEGAPIRRSRFAWLLLGGVFLGLATLTKGPAAILLLGLTTGIYWVSQRFRWFVSPGQAVIYILALLSTVSLWYGLVTIVNGAWFVKTFSIYQWRLLTTPDAGHAGFPGFHIAALLIGCFPASIFAIRGFGRTSVDHPHQQDFKRWMIVLFCVVLGVFSVVESKVVHYSSMCYFPLTFLAALVMRDMVRTERPVGRWITVGVLCVGFIWALLTTALPIVCQYPEFLKSFSSHPQATSALDANVGWTGWEVIPGLWLIAVLFLFFRHRDRARHALRILLPGVAVFVMLFLWFDINRIEGYSQRAAIEFFESLQDKDCYVSTHRYKSYASLFYSRKMPDMSATAAQRKQRLDHGWLFSGDIDKDFYVSCKVHRAVDIANIPGLERLYAKNGYVFFRRRAVR